jgi:hypothetical protein
MFIKLTLSSSDVPDNMMLYVNINYIRVMERHLGSNGETVTSIGVGPGDKAYEVKQTPEKIIELIEEVKNDVS